MALSNGEACADIPERRRNHCRPGTPSLLTTDGTAHSSSADTECVLALSVIAQQKTLYPTPSTGKPTFATNIQKLIRKFGVRRLSAAFSPPTQPTHMGLVVAPPPQQGASSCHSPPKSNRRSLWSAAPQRRFRTSTQPTHMGLVVAPPPQQGASSCHSPHKSNIRTLWSAATQCRFGTPANPIIVAPAIAHLNCYQAVCVDPSTLIDHTTNRVYNAIA